MSPPIRAHVLGRTLNEEGTVKDRNVVECERFAEETGSTCAVGGHFPDLPFGPAPTFLPPPPHVRSVRRVVDRMAIFLAHSRGST